MSAKRAILFSIPTLLLLGACALLLVHAISVSHDLDVAANQSEELESANALLRAENNNLTETIAIIQIEPENLSVDQNPKQDKSIVAFFEANPIDRFFTEIGDILKPQTTVEMAMFGSLYEDAWKAEMWNCYESLMSNTKIEQVRECLVQNRDLYVDYLQSYSELEAYFDVSGAFLGDDELFVGTLGQVLRPHVIAKGYREKTKALFGRLEEVGIQPAFVFTEEDYREQMRQELPELWETERN